MKGHFIVVKKDGTEKHYWCYANAVKCFLKEGYRFNKIDEKIKVLGKDGKEL